MYFLATIILLLTTPEVLRSITNDLLYVDTTRYLLQDDRAVRQEPADGFDHISIPHNESTSGELILRAILNAVSGQYSLADNLLDNKKNDEHRLAVGQCAISAILLNQESDYPILVEALNHPLTAQCLLPYAKKLENQGLWKQAQIIYFQILALQPTYLPARRALAENLYFFGDMRQAAEQLKIVVEQDPTAKDYYQLLKIYRLSDLGENQSAIAERAINLFPDDPWITYEYAEFVLFRAGKDEAITFLQDKTAAFDDARFEYVLCRFLDELGNMDKAIQACQQAIQKNAQYAEAHIWLSKLFLRQDKISDAMYYASIAASLENAQGAYPKFIATVNLGDVYMKQGDTEQAFRIYCQAWNSNQWVDQVEYLQRQLEIIGRDCSSGTQE